MKKYLFLLSSIIILLISFKSQAQENRFGVSAGIDAVGIHETQADKYNRSNFSYSPMLSYNFNLYYAYKSKGLIGFSIEPGYIREGTLMNDPMYKKMTKIVNNYIQMPVLLDFHISNRWFLSIGPEVAYLLNSKRVEEYITRKYDHLSNRVQLSAMIGVNYTIHKNIDLALRYNHQVPHNSKIFYFYHHYLQFLVRFHINNHSKKTNFNEEE